MNLILFVIIIVFSFLSLSVSKQKSLIKLDRFDICDIDVHSAMTWEKVNIMFDNERGTLINSEINITRRSKAIKTVTNFIRCSSKESLDSCEDFITLKVKETCALLAQKEGFFANFVYATKPPLTCPLEVGYYRQINGTFDPSLFFFFPLDKWYWKLQMKFFDYYTDEYHFNICIEGRVINKRK